MRKARKKNKIGNNVIAVIAIFFTLINIFVNLYIVHKSSITGQATSTTTSNITFCFNAPVSLNLPCNAIAYINDSYQCDVDYNDSNTNQSWTFDENSTLFSINTSSGLFNFTPNGTINESHNVLFSVNDGSNCDNGNYSEVFNLSIRIATCSDGVQNQGETGVDCGGICPACPSPPAAGGGGGGGGGKMPCTPEYTCLSWQLCMNGKTKRECVDQKCNKGSQIESRDCNLDISLNKQILKIVVQQNSNYEDNFLVINVGDIVADVNVLKNLKFVALSVDSFRLPVADRKLVKLIINTYGVEPGVYTDEVVVSALPDEEERLKLIVEVESEKKAIDVSLDIPAQYRNIQPGEQVHGLITIYNLVDKNRIDASLTYAIRDFKGNLILTTEETVSFETQASFTRIFDIPTNIVPGTYVLGVQAKYQDAIGTASELFEVRNPQLAPPSRINLLLFIIISILVVLFGFLLYQHKKHGSLLKAIHRHHFKTHEKEQVKEHERSHEEHYQESHKPVFKNFFHGLRLYRFPEEKQRLHQELEREKHQHALERLREMQQERAYNLKLEQIDKEKIKLREEEEIKKLKEQEKLDQERLRIREEEERKILEEKRKLLEEQRKEREDLMRYKDKKYLENLKRRKEFYSKLFSTLGLYRTPEQKRHLEELRKQKEMEHLRIIKMNQEKEQKLLIERERLEREKLRHKEEEGRKKLEEKRKLLEGKRKEKEELLKMREHKDIERARKRREFYRKLFNSLGMFKTPEEKRRHQLMKEKANLEKEQLKAQKETQVKEYLLGKQRVEKEKLRIKETEERKIIEEKRKLLEQRQKERIQLLQEKEIKKIERLRKRKEFYAKLFKSMGWFKTPEEKRRLEAKKQHEELEKIRLLEEKERLSRGTLRLKEIEEMKILKEKRELFGEQRKEREDLLKFREKRKLESLKRRKEVYAKIFSALGLYRTLEQKHRIEELKRHHEFEQLRLLNVRHEKEKQLLRENEKLARDKLRMKEEEERKILHEKRKLLEEKRREKEELHRIKEKEKIERAKRRKEFYRTVFNAIGIYKTPEEKRKHALIKHWEQLKKEKLNREKEEQMRQYLLERQKLRAEEIKLKEEKMKKDRLDRMQQIREGHLKEKREHELEERNIEEHEKATHEYQKLEKQLALLNHAYSSGLISEKSYDKSKGRVMNIIESNEYLRDLHNKAPQPTPMPEKIPSKGRFLKKAKKLSPYEVYQQDVRKAKDALKNHDKKHATLLYKKLHKDFSQLNQEQKKEVHNSLIELYHGLVRK